MTIKGSAGSIGQKKLVQSLIEMARATDFGDRRDSERLPFFQPVTITAEHDRPVGLSAFSRDISATGIGLLLYWPLKPGPANMIVHLGEADPVALRGDVCWCRPCGQGWYAAGIRFHEDA